MTNIKFYYIQNAKGKFVFKLVQDGIIMFEKDYSPKIDRGQDLLGIAFVETLNDNIQKELQKNPDFKWKSFDEAKAWMAIPSRIDEALERKAAMM